MISLKKIIFCFFVAFELTAMQNGAVKAPNQPNTFYQNAEDSQHADGSWSGFSRKANNHDNHCMVTIISNSKKTSSKGD